MGSVQGLLTESNDDEESRVKTKVAYDMLSGQGGVEVDRVRSVELLEECSKRGYAEAKWMLGLCCEYGMGIEQDIQRANMLYKQSSSANVVGFFLEKSIMTVRETGVMHIRYWTSL